MQAWQYLIQGEEEKGGTQSQYEPEKIQVESEEKIRTRDQDETKLQEELISGKDEKKGCWIVTETGLPPFQDGHNSLLSDLTVIPRVTCGEFVVDLEIGEPGAKVKEKAEQELRETQEVAEQSIKTLKELLIEEQHKEGLIAPMENIAWLKRFLRPTHYYPQSAFLKVKAYYEFKIRNNKHKELFNDLKPSKLEHFFNHDIMRALPVRDQHGRRILVVDIGRKWDYTKCSLDEIFRGAVVFLETAMLEPETQISGASIIFDMDGLTMRQIWHFTVNSSFVFRVVELLQTVAPMRIKGLRIVNEPNTFGKLLKLFTILMHAKFKKMIHIHGSDRASLHRHIDVDRLPPEFGGTCTVPHIRGCEWLQLLSMLDREYEVVSSYGYKKVIK